MAKRKKSKKKGKKKSAGKIKIFISHASKDRGLARQLVNAIERYIQIKPGKIRCTSVPGYKLEGGRTTSRQLRKEIEGTGVVVGLVTPSSVRSSYVLFELGAAWGLKIPTLPLLASGATAQDLPGPLKETHALHLTRRSDATQALQDLCKLAKMKPRTSNLARVTDAVDMLVSAARSDS